MATESTTAELVAGISRWIECESPSRDPGALSAMSDIIERQAADAGLTVSRHELDPATGPMLYITNRAAGDTRKGILVLAHLDTVHPIGTLQKNPCRVEAGKLYGPGSYDMKAGTYLALSALGTLSIPGSTRLPVDFLIVPDEEISSPYSRGQIEAFARNASLTLVCEPARADAGKCVTARKGVGKLRLAVRGRPSHAGMQHERGRSAIREIAHHVLALEGMTDYERGITVSVGTIQGGTTRNVVPAQAELDVDFRVPDMDAAQSVLSRMQGLQPVGPDVELDIDVSMTRPPMQRTEQVAELLARAQACAAQAGFQLDEAPMTGGGSDANFTAAMGIPTLDGLGAEGDGAHTLNEHVLVDTLPLRLEFWKLMLKDLG
nr:M20 family metallopeptidase [Pseudomonas sp.]